MGGRLTTRPAKSFAPGLKHTTKLAGRVSPARPQKGHRTEDLCAPSRTAYTPCTSRRLDSSFPSIGERSVGKVASRTCGKYAVTVSPGTAAARTCHSRRMMPPPKGMKSAGRRLWKSITDDYDLSGAELEILRQAVRVADALDDLAAVVAAEGVIEPCVGRAAHGLVTAGVDRSREGLVGTSLLDPPWRRSYASSVSMAIMVAAMANTALTSASCR